MTRHHPSGPSKLGRRAACPGSLKMEEVAKEKGLTLQLFAEEAQEGTDLHVLVNPAVAIPDTLTAEQVETVMRCREYVQGILEEPGHPKDPDYPQLYYEPYILLWGEFPSVEPLIFGTPDLVVAWTDSVTVIDFKMGWGDLDIEAAEYQLRAYAALAMYRFFRARAEVRVYQPRLRQELTAHYSDWRAIRRQIAEVFAKHASEPDRRVTGPHCRYCPAQTVCDKFQALVGETQLPATTNGGFQVAPAALARYLDLAALVAPWAERVRAHAKDQILSGVDVPGWEVVTKTVNRKATVAKPASTQEQNTLRRRSPASE